MKDNEAKNILEQTFNDKFNEVNYKIFIKNLLKEIDESENFSYAGAYIPDDYKEYIKSYKRIGKYVSADDTELDILVVNLRKQTSLDKARTMQRNFIAKYLKNRGDKDFALVAYYTEESEDWRFSFVKREYSTELDERGKVKTKEDFTPAKRYSFLVGKNEPNHTAKKQLLDILKSDYEPTFEALEKAFNIESVTNEFFEKYKGLFLRLNDELINILNDNDKVKREFEDKKIETSNFAKKLLGQIVFLYFLQKKGWLGISKDENGVFKNWGSGAKDFLRKLFDKKYVEYQNFFNDVLEPLFYEALAIERENDYYHQLKCKIPFLNGGLFEPIGFYNWQEVDIPLKDSLFEEIFQTFDLYNFTIREDEPLEKEVAVDPEMLGKVFENLLEIKDRKSKGAFYTPREIVHYMCQESLINYLDAEINQIDQAIIPKSPKQETFLFDKEPEQLNLISKEYKEIIKRDDIEFFIKHGELAIYNDLAKEEKENKSYKYHLPESIRKNAEIIDKKLADVKVCDPAIGSGAFPVGIMTEIVKARNILSTYLNDNENRSMYDLKRHAIQKSIYGVDIDSSAIDIAKLRLWLSLVVDEDDYKDIKPLPNLDYKIVCGNALLHIDLKIGHGNKFNDLEKLIDSFFDEYNSKNKNNLRRQINEIINDITENGEKFDLKVLFSDVFNNKKDDGFNIVIGNPPYLRIQGIKESNPEISDFYKKYFISATGSYDLYVLFVEKGIKILNNNGTLNYIMPHKWVNSGFGKGLREFSSQGSYLNKFISFGEYQVFNASTYTSIVLFTKQKNNFIKYYEFNKKIKDNLELEKSLNSILINDFNMISNDKLNKDVWILTENKISIILSLISNKHIKIKDIFKKIFAGIQTSKDSIYFIKDCIEKGNFIEGFSEELQERVVLEKNILKPLLKGNQVHKYEYLHTKNYVLFPYKKSKDLTEQKFNLISLEDLEQNYPKAMNYLYKNESKLRSRENNSFNDLLWYRYGRNQGIGYEEVEKLIAPDISIGGNFTYDKEGKFYSTTTVYGYIKNDNINLSYKYLLSILNSNVLWFYLRNTGNVMAHGYFRYKPAYLNDFRVPDVKTNIQKTFEIIVDYILHLKKITLETTNQKLMPIYFEQILNGMVYELYFEDILKKHDKDILKYLNDLKPISDEMNDEDKLNIITSQFNILNDIKHPVRNNLFFMDSIEEVKIIEGKNEN